MSKQQSKDKQRRTQSAGLTALSVTALCILLFSLLAFPAGAVFAGGDGQAHVSYVPHPYTVTFWSDYNRYAMTYVESVRSVGAFGEPGFNDEWFESGADFGDFKFSTDGDRVEFTLATRETSNQFVDGYYTIEFHDFSYVITDIPDSDTTLYIGEIEVTDYVDIEMSFYASDAVGNTSYHQLDLSEDFYYDEEYSINGFVSGILTNENLYAIYVESLSFTVPISSERWNNFGDEPFYIYSDLVSFSSEVSNVGEFLTFIENARENVAEVDDFTISDFLVSAVGGFFDATLFGSITFGDIFLVMIGIVLVVLFLKFFAGG